MLPWKSVGFGEDLKFDRAGANELGILVSGVISSVYLSWNLSLVQPSIDVYL